MGIGVWELVLILLIILVVFGVGKLPQLGSGIGKMVREFKNELGSRAGEKSKEDSAPDKN